MKKVFALLILTVLFIGCGVSKDNEAFNPTPIDETKPAPRDERFIPGKGIPVIKQPVNLHVMNLPGTPVLFYDNTFAFLYGASDEKNGPKVVETLKNLGIKSIDYFMFPSSDPRTFAGFKAVLNSFFVGRMGEPVWQSEDCAKLVLEAMKKGAMTERQVAGSIFMLNGITFDILYPLTGDMLNAKPEEKSTVVLVTKNDTKWLLTRDIDGAACEKMLSRGKLQKVNTLIATGGALKNLFTPEFLDAIQGDDFSTIVGVHDGEKASTRGKIIDIAEQGTYTISTEGKRDVQK